MKNYQTVCFIVLLLLLASCATTKLYRLDKAQMLGYKVAFENVLIKNDSLQKVCDKLQNECDSLILVVDSLQVEIENY